jgi:hypothetical protein
MHYLGYFRKKITTLTNLTRRFTLQHLLAENSPPVSPENTPACGHKKNYTSLQQQQNINHFHF